MARRKVDTARGVRGTRRRNTGDNNGQTKSDPALNEALGKHLASSLMGGFTNSADVLSPALREAGINPNSYFGPKGNFRIPFLESIAAAGPNGRDVSGMLGDTGGGPSGGRGVNPGGPPVAGGIGGSNIFPGGPNNGPGGMNVNPGGTIHNHGGTQHDHQGGGPGHKHGDGGGGTVPYNPTPTGPYTQQQFQHTGANFLNNFDNYNQYVNQFENAMTAMPGGGGGHTMQYIQPPVTREQWQQATVNPGGPAQGMQGGGGGPGGPPGRPGTQPMQPVPGGGGGGGGQQQAPPQYVQNWAPAHPEAFARRFPTYEDYTAGVQDPRRQAFYDSAMAQQQPQPQPMQGGGGQGGGSQHGQQGQGQGQGGGGGQQQGGGGGQGGGGPQPDLSATPGNYPTPNSYLPPGSPPVPGAGTPMTQEPAGLTGAPPSSYPWAGKGYQAPPSNMSWYNPGVGGFAGATPPTSAPVPYATADQLAQQYGLQLGAGSPPNQVANPSGGTQPWWADPAPQGPGQYDPWVESRLIGSAYKPTGGDLGAFQQAYLQAAGGDNAYTRLAMQEYLAHKAGYGQFGSLSAPTPYGYVAPHG